MNRQRILITSGPTREYLDPVRFLSNRSSGRMGCELATAALNCGFDVTIVSGPVTIDYPNDATVKSVESTGEMLDRVLEVWPQCAGMVAAAAPCDFRPASFSPSKIKKSGDADSIAIEFEKTPDILAHVGQRKAAAQWTIGFALETDQGLENACHKMQSKKCDLIVLNSPAAMDAIESSIRIIDRSKAVVEKLSGNKSKLAKRIIDLAVELRT